MEREEREGKDRFRHDEEAGKEKERTIKKKKS